MTDELRIPYYRKTDGSLTVTCGRRAIYDPEDPQPPPFFGGSDGVHHTDHHGHCWYWTGAAWVNTDWKKHRDESR